VDVVGGKAILETIATLYTEKVPLDKLREGGGTIEAGLVIQPASLKLTSGSSDKVTIKYITRRRE
jgi:hypothetical protein